MAKKKSDTFFIRAEVTSDDATFTQTEIDLGAFVDALGQSVLRIHSISTQYQYAGFPWAAQAATNLGNNAVAALGWNLVTQLPTELVGMTDKSLIASGSLTLTTDGSGNPSLIAEAEDLNPEEWRGGYLVATEAIYLGIDSTAVINPECTFGVTLECTVEKLSKEAALALALSQQ